MKEMLQSREEILEQLSSLGINGKDVYFIDYIPLLEMIWADGQAPKGEVYIFDDPKAEDSIGNKGSDTH